jgi:hypothetical protein
MALAALSTPRFIRKTDLGANEYHKNFYKLDLETISVVTSPEADQVTPLMSKIYLRLVNAPPKFLERDRVLRFEADLREAGQVTAWEQLCELLGVASATARKAILWLHETGVIGYFAGKNGVGIRIFLNRANSSIGADAAAKRQKNLRPAPASFAAAPTSTNEVTFNDSFAVKEVQDINLSSDAPKDGADANSVVNKNLTTFTPDTRTGIRSAVVCGPVPEKQADPQILSLGEIIDRLRCEIEPGLKSAASQAAAQATRSEIERTRIWFETRALPKAIRVAQSECYSLLKKHGSLDEKSQRLRAGLDVGRNVPSEVVEIARPRTAQEVNELAEVCLALLETQGQSIEFTLSEMSAESGGCLLPVDTPRVRAAAELMLAERERRD